MSKFWNFFGLLDPNDFLSGAIVDNGRNVIISLWLRDKATINGVAAYRLTPPQNIPSAKIRWKISRLDFLVSRRHPPKLIIFQRAKLPTRSITYLCWRNWMTFWRKNARRGKVSKGSCSCTTMPRLTGYLQPRKNWPNCASNVIITHLIFRIWPRQTTTCSLDWKTIESSPCFFRRGGHYCHGDLVVWTKFVLFFEWLAKVRATS